MKIKIRNRLLPVMANCVKKRTLENYLDCVEGSSISKFDRLSILFASFDTGTFALVVKRVTLDTDMGSSEL